MLGRLEIGLMTQLMTQDFANPYKSRGLRLVVRGSSPVSRTMASILIGFENPIRVFSFPEDSYRNVRYTASPPPYRVTITFSAWPMCWAWTRMTACPKTSGCTYPALSIRREPRPSPRLQNPIPVDFFAFKQPKYQNAAFRWKNPVFWTFPAICPFSWRLGPIILR